MKKALCLGINNYPDPENALSGCINDAKSWENLLKNLGFEVTLLLDSEVTCSNLISWMNEEVADAVAGDSIVITNSSHGTSIIDESGDEIDGYDEALFLYDGVLVDDQLKDILEHLKDGVKFTFISDSCFSGTVTRAKRATKTVTAKYKLKPRYVITDKRVLNLPKKKSFLGDMKEILISGCSDSEYSYDAYIDNDYHGAFSYYAVKTFTEGLTYEEWYNSIRQNLPSSDFPQTPQLEGQQVSERALDFEKVVEPETPVVNTENSNSNKTTQIVVVVIIVAIITALVLSIVL